MGRFIKRSAIPFGGYIYQNLIGLNFLYQWLEDPNLYEWVVFESDKEEDARGLDDIVAKRLDTGKLVQLQVKFTVNPHDEENHLSWDWLLQHKPNGRSLIQKWARAFFTIGEDSIAKAALITNREPDRSFEACLSGKRVLFGLIPEPTKSKIITQLAGEENALRFFASFDIDHSYQGYDSLKRTLYDRYVPKHTDSHGWLILRDFAVDWAIKTNCPSPDGHITLHLLRSILSTHRPKPLSESFKVPIGYLPPDNQFDENFLQHILTGTRPVVVLWGSPGQGKSTYLSHVCQRLGERDIPYIRHHYFLSLSDFEDRLSFRNVSNTLMHQIEVQHGEHIEGQGVGTEPENLRMWITTCATAYARLGKRFVVVVDGLDHVWRENDRNREPLESLFRHLLPVPENVILILGTQKVAEAQLPSQLPLHADGNDWIELPLMSLGAIKNWLQPQLSSSRFKLQERSSVEHEDPLTAIAEAFYEISKGHPLHLTYSLEAVIKQHCVLTPALIREMPECPDGDIRKYYRSLWVRLSHSAKDALHLIAGVDFTWPYSGLEECLGKTANQALDNISHLLYLTEAGFRPFHGSLLAYISEESEHNARLASLMPSVAIWLESKALPYLRWGWLWLVKARTGNPDELLNGPSREWVVSSLCKAYPTSQIAKILTAAEHLAFERGLYARAIHLRWLKVRLMNGVEFQLDDFDRVYECALTLSDDDYPLRNLSANFHCASIDELHMLACQYDLIGRREDAIECQEEIRKRLNDPINSGAYDRASIKDMSEKFLELAAKTGQYDPKRLTESIRGFGDMGDSFFRFFLWELSKREDVALLLPFLDCELSDEMRRDLELQIIRVSGYCKARIDEWPEFESLNVHPIVACWALIYSRSKYKAISFPQDITQFDKKSWEDASKGEIERFLHDLFFHMLAGGLEFGGIVPPFELQKFSNRPWMNTAVELLFKIAKGIANAIIQGNYPDFSTSYRILVDLSAPRDHDEFTDYRAFRRAILEISTDLHLLLSIKRSQNVICESEWRAALDSGHFVFSEWRDNYLAAQHRIVDGSVIKSEAKKRLVEEEGCITQFDERARVYLELCELALFQEADIFAQHLLRKTVECVMGYGWRKDMTIFYVLDAIAAVGVVDEAYTRSALEKVCPIVEKITILTDGDETDYAKYEMADLLVQFMPQSFARYYEDLLKTSEWDEAGRAFGKLLAHVDLHKPMGAFVASTVWDPHGIGAIRKRTKDGEAEYQVLIDMNARAFGLPQEELGKERHPGSTPIDEEHNLRIEDYGPDELRRLLADLKEKKIYVGAKKALREWFDLWVSRGQGSSLLEEIQPFLDQGQVPSEIGEILDSAFEVSLRLEGKGKAYRWIVAAQIHCRGWGDFYGKETALRRFELFAKEYRDRWQDFISDTCRPALSYSSEQLVIPHNRLVQYLVAVGQVDLAKEITDTLISIVQEEMADQPLKKPSWFLGI